MKNSLSSLFLLTTLIFIGCEEKTSDQKIDNNVKVQESKVSTEKTNIANKESVKPKVVIMSPQEKAKIKFETQVSLLKKKRKAERAAEFAKLRAARESKATLLP